MKNLHVIGKELFITSDEEIVGKNVLAYDVLNNTVAYVTNPKGKWRKIILTTDQSLDGVQAIDDEFLEWFIKNPSCEEVEFKINYSNSVMNYSYKIIIPNLEVWKDVPELEEFIDKVDTPADFDQFTFDEGIRVGAKWQAKQLFKDDVIKNLETGIALLLKKIERMYSEEEVIKIVEKSRETGLTTEFLLLTEQFKKK